MVTISVGFVHDFATGCWAATVIAVAYLDSRSVTPDVASVLNGLERLFFAMGIGCAVVVFATGAGRTFTYVDGVYGASAERDRRRALILKHVVLVVVFGAGILWQYGMAYG